MRRHFFDKSNNVITSQSRFSDRSTFSTREKTPEGFLIVDARIGRVGIQDYRVFELDLTDAPPEVRDQDPMNIIKILRPRSEVFSDETIQSFHSKPVTNNHPTEFVSSENVKDVQVGFSKDEISIEDNKFLTTRLVVQDARTIKAVEEGKAEISPGYSAQIVWAKGNDDEFGDFDAIQSMIRGNHIAIVDKGRAGPNVRIKDNHQEKTVKKIINGVPVEIADSAVEIVDTLIGNVTAVEMKLADANSTVEKVTAERDTLQGKIDAAESSKLTDVDIDKLVAERTAFNDSVKKLSPELDVAGKTTDEVKRAVIMDKLPKADLEGKSEEYVHAMFDSIVAGNAGKSDSQKLADALVTDADADGGELSVSETARKKFIDSRNNKGDS